MKKIIKKLWFPLMFLILILYHSFLMQMTPWQIQKLDCNEIAQFKSARGYDGKENLILNNLVK